MYTLKFMKSKISQPSKTVISFALYGNAQKYLPGLYNNCRLIRTVYPSFWIYIYIGNDFDKSILNILNEFKDIKLIETHKSGHINMSYRFITIDNEDVNIAFSRDADSIINERDMYCINRFISSPYKFQIIRDNPSHGTEILGGMWGIKKGLLTFSVKDEIDLYFKDKISVNHGDDQYFLSNKIYHLVQYNAIVFDEFFNYPREYKEKINTSESWTSLNHVGACVQ
jgi:hypothetical protein